MVRGVRDAPITAMLVGASTARIGDGSDGGDGGDFAGNADGGETVIVMPARYGPRIAPGVGGKRESRAGNPYSLPQVASEGAAALARC